MMKEYLAFITIFWDVLSTNWDETKEYGNTFHKLTFSFILLSDHIVIYKMKYHAITIS